MKSRISVAATAVVVAIIASLGFASMVSAAPKPKLDRQDISSKQCKPEDSHAKQLVNVHYTLLNDADSGFAGNAWAQDTIYRQLRIWQRSDGTFCVQVADHGTFVTYAGTSPSGSSTVSAGVEGKIDGGYITTDLVGAFTPTRPTRGNLGVFDLQCDTSFNCPGSAPSWRDYLPTAVGKEFAQWGWIYRAGGHGTWLNQDDVAPANSGDITG